MKYNEIEELYFITTIDCVESIIKIGIYCRNEMEKKKIPFRDCADPEILEKRRTITVPGGRPLLDYANLYFSKRPPMHHNMKYRQRIPQKDICYICIDKDVLLIRDTVFTDGSAIYDGTYKTGFYKDLKKMERVNGEIINAENFLAKNPDGSLKLGHKGFLKRKKQAEVLVPKKVPPDKIQRIVVFNEKVKEKLEQKINENIEIVVDTEFYF